jgi:hypothetical protein
MPHRNLMEQCASWCSCVKCSNSFDTVKALERPPEMYHLWIVRFKACIRVPATPLSNCPSDKKINENHTYIICVRPPCKYKASWFLLQFLLPRGREMGCNHPLVTSTPVLIAKRKIMIASFRTSAFLAERWLSEYSFGAYFLVNIARSGIHAKLFQNQFWNIWILALLKPDNTLDESLHKITRYFQLSFFINKAWSRFIRNISSADHANCSVVLHAQWLPGAKPCKNMQVQTK